MNVWMILLLGIIIGWIIGVIIVRQNYETCRKQIEVMKKDLFESGEQLEKASRVLDGLAYDIQDKENQLQTLVHE